MHWQSLLEGRLRLFIGLAILLVFLAHASGLMPLRALNGLERQAYDLRVRSSLPETIDDRIVIANIDEKSLAELGRWPWGRDVLAKMVDTLTTYYHVRVIGFDVIFAEPDSDSGLRLMTELAQGPLQQNGAFQAEFNARKAQLDHDGLFAQSLKNRPIVLGMVFSQSPGESRNALPIPFASLKDADAAKLTGLIHPTTYTTNLDVFSQNAAMTGFFDNPSIDSDGIFRRVPLLQLYNNQLFPSLALATAHLALGHPPVRVSTGKNGDYEEIEGLSLGDYLIPTDRFGNILVPWRGGASSFPYMPIADILAKRIPIEDLKDRIVLVGTSAPGLLDLRSTPVANAYPGVEVHANIISGILDDRVWHAPAWGIGVEILLLLLTGLITLLVTPRLSPTWQMALTLCVAIGLIGFNTFAWHNGLVLPLASSLLLLAILFTYTMSWGFFAEAHSKRSITRLFGQYVPPDLVQEMAQHPENISLEGQSKELTVLFSDVRGFTNISEGLSATELSALMNAYLTAMTRVIHRHRGTIDKYMGDAIMAFWGAPVGDPDHARHALLTALDMAAELHTLGNDFRTRGWPVLHIGIGLNTGTMNVGNMGSEFRMAYTVMGDAVNLGSRLESLSKQYGVTIVVSAFTAAAVPEYSYRTLDCVRVKGKLEPVKILEPVAETIQLTPSMLELLQRWESALDAYGHQDWDTAEQNIRKLLAHDDRPLYHLYLERIAHFRETPPSSDWDGVYTYTSK
jgi:adenylate cyclase